MNTKNLTVKIVRYKTDIEDVQRDIEILNQDLHYIKFPQLRAVAENMVKAKRLKVDRLKADINNLQYTLAHSLNNLDG